MAARFVSNKPGFNRCSFAVACSSARIRPIVDTAVILVVSICIVGRAVLLLPV